MCFACKFVFINLREVADNLANGKTRKIHIIEAKKWEKTQMRQKTTYFRKNK